VNEKDENKESSSCSGTCSQVEVPSKEEVDALDRMRAIKIQVRELKRVLSGISSSNQGRENGKIAELEGEMTRLKEEWNKWEKKREEAAHQRMILLGHEEP
jgi:hypothetical protein